MQLIVTLKKTEQKGNVIAIFNPLKNKAKGSRKSHLLPLKFHTKIVFLVFSTK